MTINLNIKLRELISELLTVNPGHISYETEHLMLAARLIITDTGNNRLQVIEDAHQRNYLGTSEQWNSVKYRKLYGNANASELNLPDYQNPVATLYELGISTPVLSDILDRVGLLPNDPEPEYQSELFGDCDVPY